MICPLPVTLMARVWLTPAHQVNISPYGLLLFPVHSAFHIQMSLPWVKPFGKFPNPESFCFRHFALCIKKAAPPSPPSFQLGESALQLHIAGCPRDIMSDHAAKSLRLDGRQFAQSILDHRSAQRDKGISIVKAKWRKLVTLPANIQGVSKRHSNLARIFPEFPCWLVSFGSGLVKGAFLLAKGQIDRRDRLPGPILKPPLIHAPLRETFLGKLALIF